MSNVLLNGFLALLNVAVVGAHLINHPGEGLPWLNVAAGAFCAYYTGKAWERMRYEQGK
jgi:hypothetical protein